MPARLWLAPTVACTDAAACAELVGSALRPHGLRRPAPTKPFASVLANAREISQLCRGLAPEPGRQNRRSGGPACHRAQARKRTHAGLRAYTLALRARGRRRNCHRHLGRKRNKRRSSRQWFLEGETTHSNTASARINACLYMLTCPPPLEATTPGNLAIIRRDGTMTDVAARELHR